MEIRFGAWVFTIGIAKEPNITGALGLQLHSPPVEVQHSNTPTLSAVQSVPSIYSDLENETDPEKKTQLVLRHIEENGSLHLPRIEAIAADLSQVDLSSSYLQKLRASTIEPVLWWDENIKGANLRGAQLRGAKLDSANLQGANLTGADLSNTSLWDAKLASARLQGACLTGADLSLADMSAADLFGLDLREVNNSALSRVKLAGASLRFTKLQGVDLASCATGNRIFLYGAEMDEATRISPYLLGDMIGEEAVSRSHNEIELCQYIDSIDSHPEILYRQAKRTYRKIKQCFYDRGEYTEGVWAYRRERQMEEREAYYAGMAKLSQLRFWSGLSHIAADTIRCRISPKESCGRLYGIARQVGSVVSCFLKMVGDWFAGILCDYGEGLGRVFLCLIAIFCLFTIGFGVTDSVGRVGPAQLGNENATPIRLLGSDNWIGDLKTLALFSLGAMTTMDVDGVVPLGENTQFVAGIEALLGIAITGLFGFVLGNRLRRP